MATKTTKTKSTGLTVTTDPKTGKITSAQDSKGSYSVDQNTGKATLNSGGSSGSSSSAPASGGNTQTFKFMNDEVDVSVDPNTGQATNNVVARRYVNPDKPAAAVTTPTVAVKAPKTPTAKDPIASYYNNLRDYNPDTDDEAIRKNIRKTMQSSLDAIDQKYNTIYADEARNANNRLGATRSMNARGGLLGSDFGEQNNEETRTYNSEKNSAITANKNYEVQGILREIDSLAKQEIQARKQEALGKMEGLAKLQTDSRNLLGTIAKTGAQLTDEQRNKLMEQTGYDPLTFEAVFNASKPVPEYFAPMQLKDGSLVVVDKQGNMKNLGKYDLPEDYQFTFAPDGTPFVFDKSTGIAKIAAEYAEGQFAKPVSVGKNSRLVDPNSGRTVVNSAPTVNNNPTPATVPPRNNNNSNFIGPVIPQPSKAPLTSKEVSKVNAIIKANPGEYGNAAAQINKELGAGSATRADNLLKSAYMIPSNASQIANQLGQPKTVADYNAWRQQFINDHNYNPTAAAAAFDKFIKKPAAGKTNSGGIDP